MKIETANEVLTDLMTTKPQFSPEMRRKAVLLGIEAMKRYQEQCRYPGMRDWPKLPGETEE